MVDKSKIEYFNNGINNFLKEKFGKEKDVNFYSRKMYQEKNLKNIWESIAFVENVDLNKFYVELMNKALALADEAGIKLFFLERSFGNLDEIREYLCKNKRLNVRVEHKIIKLTFPYIPLYLLKEEEDLSKVLFIVTFGFEKVEKKKESEAELNVKYEKLLFEIIRKALLRGASDVHIYHKRQFYYVYYRVHGFYVEDEENRLSVESGLEFITYLLRKASTETKGIQFNPDNRLTAQDARISLFLDGKKVDLRLVFIPDGYSLQHLEVVIRLLLSKEEEKEGDEGELEKKLLNLGYLDEDILVLKTFLSKSKGVCVISGITNSGKSTLIHTLLSSIKHRKIGTVEDPIEFYLWNKNVVQHQIFLTHDENLRMDFADYIKAFKRGDYDVIFIGEWRNHKGLTESIIEQSFAGQLIWTTLHIANSFQIYEALHHMYGVEFEELKAVLLLSWNQVLFPKLCDGCKVVIRSLPKEFIDKLNLHFKMSLAYSERILSGFYDSILSGHKEFWGKGKGCEKCGGLGYVGRTVIYDYFVPNFEFYQNLKGFSFVDVYLTAKEFSLAKTKLDVFLEKVQKGEVSILDVVGGERFSGLL